MDDRLGASCRNERHRNSGDDDDGYGPLTSQDPYFFPPSLYVHCFASISVPGSCHPPFPQRGGSFLPGGGSWLGFPPLVMSATSTYTSSRVSCSSGSDLPGEVNTWNMILDSSTTTRSGTSYEASCVETGRQRFVVRLTGRVDGWIQVDQEGMRHGYEAVATWTTRAAARPSPDNR